MEKTIEKLVLAFVIISLALISLVYAKEDEIVVSLNNNPVAFNDDLGYPRVVNGRTLVPLRVISEDMGFNVKWNNSLRQVTVTDEKTTLILTIGSNKALVNGKEVSIDIREDGKVADTKAVIIKERTYVPLRFISENMGAKVDWERKAGKLYVYITQEGFTPPVINQPNKLEGTADYNDPKGNISKIINFLGEDVDERMSGQTETSYSPLKHLGTDSLFFYVIDRKEDGHNVEINIKNWYKPADHKGAEFEQELKDISPTVKEVLRFYLPETDDKLHKMIDDGFNFRWPENHNYIDTDISKIIGSSKKVKIVEDFGVLRIQIGDGQ